MDRFSFWQRWLFAVSLIIVVFGLALAVLNRTPLLGLFDRQINPVFWGAGEVPAGVDEFLGFIYGVLGATVAGWGVFLAFIAHHPFKRKENWSWYCLVVGLLVWFLTDTAISLYFNVYFNVILNSILLVLTLLPLVFTRKFFR